MDFEDFKENVREAQRAAEREKERLEDEANKWTGLFMVMNSIGEMVKEMEQLREENEELRNDNQKLTEEKEQLEMKLKELQKLTDGVAKKSSQEEVIKAIRTFVNNSKRKKIDKRAAAKEMVLEFITTNRIDVPQDLMDVILSLDDEQPEPPKSETHNHFEEGSNCQVFNGNIK